MAQLNNKYFEVVCESQPPMSMLVLKRVAKWVNNFQNTGMYTPYIHVKRSSTVGKGAKVFSPNSDSTHELLSILEQRLLSALEFMPNVIAVYTQYPLTPLRESLLIADSLGIRHPSFTPRGKNISDIYNEDQAAVMTTDFVISYYDEEGEVNKHAIALKMVNEKGEYSDKQIRAKNIANKLEIEREYWARRGINWMVATSDMPYFQGSFTYNLLLAEDKRDFAIEPELLDRIKQCVQRWLLDAPTASFDMIKKQVAHQLKQSTGLIYCAIWKLIWQQALDIDITKPIVFNRPFPQGERKWLWQ